MFFFSSRRRHTISLCDWSSDVCSSDLQWFAGKLSFEQMGQPLRILNGLKKVPLEGQGARNFALIKSDRSAVIRHRRDLLGSLHKCSVALLQSKHDGSQHVLKRALERLP